MAERPTAESERLYREACGLMPGGVSSPVRAFGAVGGHPPFIARGEGAYLVDVDGNRYVDYVLSWGPLILGHAHPRVVAALQKAVSRGTSYGAPSPTEHELARLVREAMPSLELLRFVNSGTEATMSAIRRARAFTGRSAIVKFAGNYHGHADALLVKAGSGVATLGLPDSPGVPAAAVRDTLTAPYNDLAAIEELFDRLPGGAYGGRREVRELVAPSGPVYQAGTLSGNPLAMVAGAETLRALREPGVWDGIERAAAALVAGLEARARAAGVAVQCARVGTMFGLFFVEAPVTTWEEARLADTERFGAFHRALLDGGVYLAPSQFETGFLSVAHGDAEIAATLRAAEVAFAAVR